MAMMKQRIHVKILGIGNRTELPPSLPPAQHDKSIDSSFSVAQIKKRFFSQHRHSVPIHVSSFFSVLFYDKYLRTYL